MPGICEVVGEKRESRKFARFVRTDGFSVSALFHKTSSNCKTGHHPDSTTGYASTYYRSRLVGDKRISVHKNLHDFRGIIKGEHFFANYGRRGPQEAKDVFGNHIITAVDPGVHNTAGMVTVAADLEASDGAASLVGRFVPSKISTARYYQETSTRTKDRNMREYSGCIKALSEFNPRTANTEKLKLFKDSYVKNSKPIRLYNQSRGNLAEARLRRLKKQRFWSTVVNEIREQIKALQKLHPKKTGAPIILFGDGNFSSKGHRQAPNKFLLKYLSKFFLVVIINEAYTSQNCPKCFGKLKKIEETGTRHWYCDAGDCRSTKKGGVKADRFLVHKDISAPMNFVTIFAQLLLTGTRPPRFCHNRDKH
jgi:hypothetical protein